MKKLPVGIQSLRELIEGGYLYVDKTEYVHRLITSGKHYFLSRPRRFGKSLLVSTLKEIFEGNRTLFQGLWIQDRIDWKAHPVIHIDFSTLGHRGLGLEQALDVRLHECAQQYRVELTQPHYSLRFRELIMKLSRQAQSGVVLLVDEYDKPIIDYLEDLSVAAANREVLKNFYAMIKGSDEYLKLVFLTGVSKFSQVSVFSDLNNLDDISFNKHYATMLGYTQAELDTCFRDNIDRLCRTLQKTSTDVNKEIRRWYNGYSWDAQQYVYNPFSVLKLFASESFANYWYTTGTPTFLLKLLRAREFSSIDLDGLTIKRDLLDKYEIDDIDIPVLLFQTGYLTIKEANLQRRTIRLDYPNLEVEASFSEHLLAEYTDQSPSRSSALLGQIAEALREDRVDRFIELLTSLFAGITYQQIENRESYYHSVFYLVLKLIGFDIQCEILTNRGRIDAVIKTDTHIYITEFKLGQASLGLAQIKEMGYHQTYLHQGKTVVLLGIGFDTATRNIGDYELETIGE